MTPKLYYALESLPELLGERQFKMLCDALDIAEDRFLDIKGTRGEAFAHLIEERLAERRIERCRATSSVFAGF
jgi:hypothetical protein